MPKIFPFRAFRYSFPESKYPALISPPYDVIGDLLAEKLRKNPNNAIHMELPNGKSPAKYINARECWQTWLQKGIVQKDPVSAFYIYQQSFRLQHRTHSRIGFFCEVALEKPGKGSILRHELTLPKPKKDRLELLRTTQLNTSPIFGLFSDDRKTISHLLHAIARTKPYIQFSENDKIMHRLWLCYESSVANRITKVLRQAEIVIADGHHRYETAWEYYEETRSHPKTPSPLVGEGGGEGAASVLFYLCPMESSGLVIFPTHRVLTKNWNLARVLQKLESVSAILMPSDPKPVKAKNIDRDASFLISDGKKKVSVAIRSFKELKKKFPQCSAAYLKLSLFHLHSILFPELKKEDFIYTHNEKEALELARKKSGLAFLVPPVTVQELFAIVKNKELMPQKSTYFYPKIPSGILFRSTE